MTTFYAASETEQSAWMICLFFALLLDVFLFLTSLDRSGRRWNRLFNIGIFIALLILLCTAGDAFHKTAAGLPAHPRLPFPMWLLWCIAGMAGTLLLGQSAVFIHEKDRTLSRNSVKQAMDMLPSAVCYFTPSGALKLCNLQMYRLFRILAHSDLQQFHELQQALTACDRKSSVVRLPEEVPSYLFPDGKVWRYSQTEITVLDGTVYTKVVFSDVTELYEKGQKLREQTAQLKKFSRDLKVLSDNVLTLTKEAEVLSAKTRLHDQMGAGIIAMRQILQQDQVSREAADSLLLFQKAIRAIKNDDESPQECSMLAEFLQDAATIGVKVELTGEMPKQWEIYRIFVIAMRECLTNSVRHADATALSVTARQDGRNSSLCITNNGIPPKGAIVPKGGLRNLHRHVTNSGGTMEIRWTPAFALTITIPTEKEAAE